MNFKDIIYTSLKYMQNKYENGFIILFCFLFLILSCNKTKGDQLYFRGIQSALELDITSNDQNTLTATIQKQNIINISVNTLDNQPFPDSFLLLNKHNKVSCKIIESKSNHIIANIPMQEIARFDINVSDELKGDLFIYENNFDANNTTANTNNLIEQKYIYEEEHLPDDFGTIKGSIVSNGKPISKCQIKIYKLETKIVFLKKTYVETIHYETITNVNGNYYFEKIQKGGYKLYWKRSLGEQWTKRIEMEPDFFVWDDKKTFVGILDIDKGTLE